MEINLDTTNSLNYQEWVYMQDSLDASTSKEKYSQYLLKWYENQKVKKEKDKRSVKEDYIKLLKDLSFLFDEKEKDIFLSNIDYTNDEELILAIPFFAKKLKQISQVLCGKRESVKDSKVKYNLVGSNFGFEKLLYDYILKSFTSLPNELTKVPIASLSETLPALSSVKDDFYIEVEELYDPTVYFDSDPSVDINEYFNLNELTDKYPYQSLTPNQLSGLLITRYLPKIADTPLSNLFNAYLNENIPITTTYGDLSSSSKLVSNELMANKKYASETVYGLTAIRLKDVYLPDKQISIDIKEGNSWFLWPSGDRLLDDLEFNNIYAPIYINESNFLNSGSTAGSSYDTSDLIFTDKNGFVEGAWLNGIRHFDVKDEMSLRISKQTYKDFLFPFVGFDISSKGNNFLNYSIKDTIYDTIDLLDAQKKKELISTYYTNALPNSSVNDIYLNQTKLVYCGAYASAFSDEADTITKKPKTFNLPEIFSEADISPIDEAFLYKFDKTDLPIKEGTNNIYWPIQKFDTFTDMALTIDDKTCLPVALADIDVSSSMLGAVAGLDFSSSDLIYKLNTSNGEPIEAAWLSSNSITNYDIDRNSIRVYDDIATKCSQYIEGPAQAGLSLIIQPAEKMSFVWGDVDTPANEVFRFIEHTSDCPYAKKTHDYYEDQDYRNPNPLFSKNYWNECKCKSLQYSPIGHIGEKYTDYNAMTDFIFADPDGVGSDFALSNWSDTRGLNYKKSPQFAYYKLDESNSDKNVGWGTGEWKNGNGTTFILKTGRRYTYYRSSFRKNLEDRNKSPYYIVKYAYTSVNGYIKSNKPLDLVIGIDISKTEFLQINNVKSIISSFLRNIITEKNEIDIQVSLMTFGTTVNTVSFLSKDINLLDLELSNIGISTDKKNYKTNIADALLISKDILTKASPENAKFNIKDLCTKLNYIISNPVKASSYLNTPNKNANKKVLLFTNGIETVKVGRGVINAKNLKASGIDIYVVDVGVTNPDLSINSELITSPSNYINLEKYLILSDNDLDSFAANLLYRINDMVPVKPSWSKAIRNESGSWVSTNEISDMVLRPGDHLIYIHRKNINYYTNGIINTFKSTTPSFTLNVKLDGWDYYSNSFNIDAYGEGFGAKPFWAKVYTDINLDGNFKKQTMKFGGDLRFFDDYVPMYQPEISNMVLKTGDFLRYKRIHDQDLNWIQTLSFTAQISSYKWKQLLFQKEFSNLNEILYTDNLQTVTIESDELSDILLEGYSSFNLAYYNYYARKDFTYTQDLFFNNRCVDSFVVYNTAAVITPTNPYSNTLNVHYPTIATLSFPSKATTLKQTGDYLSPDKLGVPTYRGVGYDITIDNDSLTYFDSISTERFFYDVEKYGPRQRGLTKKDQLTPTKVNKIDSSWMYEPYGSGDKTGIITESLKTQKFTPYQTSYEIELENKHGVIRQTDNFEFFTKELPSIWNNEKEYPLTFRKEITLEQYDKRKKRLLTNIGELYEWRTDIFGNNYGLFKQVLPSSIKNLGLWFTSDYGALSGILPNRQTNVNGNVIRWLDKSGNERHLNAYNTAPELNSSFLKPMNPPVLKENLINGKPAIYFDGTSNLHLNYYLRDASQLTVYVVGKYFNANNGFAKNNYQPLLAVSLSSGNKSKNYNYFENETFAIYQSFGKNAFSFGNPVLDSNNPNLFGKPIIFDKSVDGVAEIQQTNSDFNIFEFVFTPSFASSFINNQYYINTTNLGKTLNKNLNMADINLSDGLWIGSYGAGQFPTKCAVAEIIVFERALTNRERIDMNNYLSDKYFNGFY
jgi:hypothetical protein